VRLLEGSAERWAVGSASAGWAAGAGGRLCVCEAGRRCRGSLAVPCWLLHATHLAAVPQSLAAKHAGGGGSDGPRVRLGCMRGCLCVNEAGRRCRFGQPAAGTRPASRRARRRRCRPRALQPGTAALLLVPGMQQPAR